MASQFAGAAELVGGDPDAGELLHHRRTVDEPVTRLGHHDEVGDAEQQGGTRHGRTVDHEHGRHDAGAVDERLGQSAPALQGGEALDDVGTGGGEHEHQRHALDAGGLHRLFDDRRDRRRQRDGAGGRARLRPQLDPDDVAIVDDAYVGRHRRGHPAPEPQGRNGHAATLPRARSPSPRRRRPRESAMPAASALRDQDGDDQRQRGDGQAGLDDRR